MGGVSRSTGDPTAAGDSSETAGLANTGGAGAGSITGAVGLVGLLRDCQTFIGCLNDRN